MQKQTKKLLLSLAVISILVCAFALSVSAKTIYKENAESDILFSCTFDENNVVTEYDTTKSFPKFDKNNKALTWYLTGENETDADGNTVKYVKSVLTSQVFNASTGKYNDGSTFSHTVVSANFDNDGTVTKFSSTLFGGISSYSKDLLFVYIPDSVVTVGERFCQNVKSVIVIEFTDNSKCSSIGKFFALYARSLRAINIPAPMETLYMSEHLGLFENATALETVTFAPNSQLKVIEGKTFFNTGIRSITLPNTVTTIGTKAFQNCPNLSYINVGSSFTTFRCDYVDYFSFIFGSASEITVVMPNNQITLDLNGYTDKDKKAFGYLFKQDGITFNYAGTESEFEAFKKVINESGYGNNEGLNKAKVVYVSKCDAFYGGVHSMSSQLEMQLTSYFAPITFSSVCQNGCGETVVDESKTIPAIFTYRGYSCTEKAINGFHSMTQAYSVDADALAEYKKINPEFKYGLVAAGCENPLDENVDASKVVNYPNEKFAREYFEIKVQGISGDNMEKAVVFCLYVIDNGTYYLDNNTVSETVTGISFNELYAIKYPTEEGEAA